LIEKAGWLRLIMVQGSGPDKVDIKATTQRGVCVANAPDYIAETVADHVMALILAHYRNIVRGDRYVREGRWISGVPNRSRVER
jgi:lactate dehydrogenase-like 2-hydroxyacid dehydrogenase